jgi:hypothetical protein|tara:strand:- start:52 stop:486 length:435 start_codon:yes stop_codon:yes gene_type:complete
MSIEKTNQIMGVFANVGVLLGIIFLAIELQQNNALMETRARAEFADRATSTMSLVAANPQLAEIMARPLAELSAGEQLQRRHFFLRFMKNLEFLFLESNDISELPIVGWRAGFQDSDNLQMWELEKQSFKQRFIEFVETELIGR